jgi:hypothetical protein
MNGTETVTVKEIAEALGIKTKTSILRRAEKENWPHTNGGNRAKLYFLDQLPPEVQERIARHRYGIDDGNVEEMAERFEIKTPPARLNDPAIATKIRMVSECLAIPQNVRGRRARIKYIAKEYGFNVATAYRLMERVKQGKEIITSTKNYGIRIEGLGLTLRAWDQEAAEMAVREIMANRHEHREKLNIYEQIKLKAESSNLKIGCYGSFLNLNRRIGEDVKTYRDKGIRGLREDIIPAIRRDASAYRPMENLIGDQHKADYYAVDSNGDPAILELFCWMDFRTQLMWGSIAYKHYNRYTVGRALMHAISWGLPSIVYTDWGKPEESIYLTMLLEQIKGLGIRTDGVRHVRAKVKHPQAKPIEGRFGWLDKKVLNKRLPGYCKRLKDVRENDLLRKEIERQIKAGELLSMSEMTDEIFSVIEEWNIHKFKNRNEDTGASPLGIYNKETQTYPVTTLSDDVLDYIFLPYQQCTIKRSQVRIKHDWLGRITYYDPELSNCGGAEASVRYDPFDPYHAWVFVDGKLVCRAEEWGMINPKVSDQVMQRIEMQNSLARQVKAKYEAYKPERKGIPRIGPHDREARQVRQTEDGRQMMDDRLERAVGGLRVMKTPLDEPEGADIVRDGQGLTGVDREKGYRPLVFQKAAQPERIRPLFNFQTDRQSEDQVD